MVILKAEAGTWVKTADGKCRACIFLNSASASSTSQKAASKYAALCTLNSCLIRIRLANAVNDN